MIQSYSPGGAIYRKTKMVATAMSLSCRVSAIAAFCWPTTQTPSITNLPSHYRLQKASYSSFCPKIGCHGKDLRHSISAMFSWDSLTPKTHPLKIKQRVASYHTTKVIANRKPKYWLPWQRSLALVDPI